MPVFSTPFCSHLRQNAKIILSIRSMQTTSARLLPEARLFAIIFGGMTLDSYPLWPSPEIVSRGGCGHKMSTLLMMVVWIMFIIFLFTAMAGRED